MHDLKRALSDHELIVLRVMGEWWDLDLTGMQKPACVSSLAERLSLLDMGQEVAYLGPEEADAFQELVNAGGRMPVAKFERQHGQVRQMGPGRLEREEPWYDPVSPAEGLWYRGFLYRAFDEGAGDELVEYYYLPNELMVQFRDDGNADSAPTETDQQAPDDTGLAPLDAPGDFESAPTSAVDDLTALLTAAQIGLLDPEDLTQMGPLLLNLRRDYVTLLYTLALELGLLRESGEGPKPTRFIVDWLQQTREGQLRDLVDAWSASAWNDLCHTPGLSCEGSGWENDPLLARTALLDALPRRPEWYQLQDLIMRVKATDPDFQRPDGNYSTWYVRDTGSNEYLAGYESWDLVEGRLLHYLVTGPLHWLGMCAVAAPDRPTATRYQLTQRALDWLAGRPAPQEEVTVPIVVRDDAAIDVPFNANRYHRFQVGRVTTAQPVRPGKPFTYRLTPASLRLAREQGIDPDRVLTFLAEASGRKLPPATQRAVERWAENGTEARLERWILLRVRDAEILEKLRANPRTNPYIAETVGELAAAVRADEWPALRQAAAQLGLLLETANLYDLD